jgi:hypothetical protein
VLLADDFPLRFALAYRPSSSSSSGSGGAVAIKALSPTPYTNAYLSTGYNDSVLEAVAVDIWGAESAAASVAVTVVPLPSDVGMDSQVAALLAQASALSDPDLTTQVQ